MDAELEQDMRETPRSFGFMSTSTPIIGRLLLIGHPACDSLGTFSITRRRSWSGAAIVSGLLGLLLVRRQDKATP
jgi:hypothetical protein